MHLVNLITVDRPPFNHWIEPFHMSPGCTIILFQGQKGSLGEPGYRGPPGLNGTFYGHGSDGDKGEGIPLLKRAVLAV